MSAFSALLSLALIFNWYLMVLKIVYLQFRHSLVRNVRFHLDESRHCVVSTKTEARQIFSRVLVMSKNLKSCLPLCEME